MLIVVRLIKKKRCRAKALNSVFVIDALRYVFRRFVRLPAL